MAANALELPVYQFIARRRQLCGERPSPEPALLLTYFEDAGNEFPVFNGRPWFFKAWRVGEIIQSPGSGDEDMAIWHLVKVERLIQKVVTEMLPEVNLHAV